MDESQPTDPESAAPPPGPSNEPRDETQPSQPQSQLSDDANRRRGRRGRRGRGGGGFGGPRPQFGGPRPPFAGQRPQYGGQQFRPQPRFPAAEDSEQARELGAYERRQAQRQRGGQRWRGPGQGLRAGGWGRGPRAGQQGYAEQIRRVTAGPRTTAPSHAPAGEPIAGPHPILEAIRAGRNIRRLYVSEDRSLRTGAVNELITEAQQRRIFVRYVDKLEIARLSPVENHQGVVAIVEGKAGVELDELLLHLDTLSEPALVLILDSLQDPQNFGVLLRSAEGAGVDGVVIPHHRAVGLTPAVAKTSAGASEHLLIADVANLRQAIDALKDKGVWVVGADDSGDLLYDEVDYRGATAIVIGGEGEGIRRLVLEGCDQVVRIPMQGHVASLNAAAAGTVMLYEALRQRRRDVPPAQTRTPRPERPAAEPQNGEVQPIEPAEAPEDETDETDQLAVAGAPPRETAERTGDPEPMSTEEAQAASAAQPAATDEAPETPPEKPKRARSTTPRKRTPKKTSE